MNVDKQTNQIISGNAESAIATHNVEPVPVPIQVEANGAADVIHAIIEILKEVTWEYGVDNSPKIFKTVQRDDGQYNRLVNAKLNGEEAIGLPAAFVHLINMNWIVSGQKFNEGRAELRIRFLLNSLDTHSSNHDTDVYYVAERIHQTITLLKSNYECLTKRCQLTYVDPLETFEDGVQPCWLTYDVWFVSRSIWVTRFKTYRKVVCPPFTNHSDQDQTDPSTNIHNHTNASHPVTYDEASGYEIPETE